MSLKVPTRSQLQSVFGTGREYQRKFPYSFRLYATDVIVIGSEYDIDEDRQFLSDLLAFESLQQEFDLRDFTKIEKDQDYHKFSDGSSETQISYILSAPYNSQADEIHQDFLTNMQIIEQVQKLRKMPMLLTVTPTSITYNGMFAYVSLDDDENEILRICEIEYETSNVEMIGKPGKAYNERAFDMNDFYRQVSKMYKMQTIKYAKKASERKNTRFPGKSAYVRQRFEEIRSKQAARQLSLRRSRIRKPRSKRSKSSSLGLSQLRI